MTDTDVSAFHGGAGRGLFHKTFWKNLTLGNIPAGEEMNHNEELKKRSYKRKGKERLNQEN